MTRDDEQYRDYRDDPPEDAEVDDDEEGDGEPSCAACGASLVPSVNAPPGVDRVSVGLLEVVYAVASDGVHCDDLELFVDDRGDPIYPPLYYGACHVDTFVDELRALSRNPARALRESPGDFGLPHTVVNPEIASTCRCDVCRGAVLHHDNLVRLRWGELDRTPRRGGEVIQFLETPRGEEGELLICLPCMLLLEGYPYTDDTPEPLTPDGLTWGFWEDLAHDDECPQCTYAACHWEETRCPWVSTHEGCTCACHDDSEETDHG